MKSSLNVVEQLDLESFFLILLKGSNCGLNWSSFSRIILAYVGGNLNLCFWIFLLLSWFLDFV